MALKSKEWFYKQCLIEVERHGRFAHLCWDILEKGIGQSDSTRGHVTQAIGACQQFLRKHPQHRSTIRSSDPTRPFNVTAHKPIRKDLQKWLFAQKRHRYGRKSFGYSYITLKNI